MVGTMSCLQKVRGPAKSGRPRASDWGAAECLSLAAAPTFAVMALLTAVLGGGPLAMLCGAAPDASPLTGMVPMYLLMTAFHAAPWLKLISSRQAPHPESSPGARHSVALMVFRTAGVPPAHDHERAGRPRST
jgi:hypothetical protein